MSALPCSSSLPWHMNGLTPLGLVMLTSVFLTASFSRSAQEMIRPSFSNRPSSNATNSGRPWNGAVDSSVSFFIAHLLAVRAEQLTGWPIVSKEPRSFASRRPFHLLQVTSPRRPAAAPPPPAGPPPLPSHTPHPTRP